MTYQKTSKWGHKSFLSDFPRSTIFLFIYTLEINRIEINYSRIYQHKPEISINFISVHNKQNNVVKRFLHNVYVKIRSYLRKHLFLNLAKLKINVFLQKYTKESF